jgi:2,3-bisphosphoglycerate-independent phosphoglycerate mutase
MASDFALGAHPTLPKGLPVCVAILDGYGENEFKDEYNAVHSAKTPVFDKLRSNASRFRTVAAHGPAVGLPSSDDMGNSEVGHNALGAGKIYAQGAKLVDLNLASGQLYKDEGWGYIKTVFATNTVHFIGLLSSGGVHSRYNQLIALVKQAAADGAKKIRLHVLTDGRDVPDNTGAEYIEQLETDLRALEASHAGDFKIASGGGRMKVTMDRYEADWPMVERGWKAHVLGEAPTKSASAMEAYKALKEGGVSDQNIGSFVVVGADGKAVGTIEDGDAVVVANFRSDRVIEISKAFECVCLAAERRPPRPSPRGLRPAFDARADCAVAAAARRAPAPSPPPPTPPPVLNATRRAGTRTLLNLIACAFPRISSLSDSCSTTGT